MKTSLSWFFGGNVRGVCLYTYTQVRDDNICVGFEEINYGKTLSVLLNLLREEQQ